MMSTRSLLLASGLLLCVLTSCDRAADELTLVHPITELSMGEPITLDAKLLSRPELLAFAKGCLFEATNAPYDTRVSVSDPLTGRELDSFGLRRHSTVTIIGVGEDIGLLLNPDDESNDAFVLVDTKSGNYRYYGGLPSEVRQAASDGTRLWIRAKDIRSIDLDTGTISPSLGISADQLDGLFYDGNMLWVVSSNNDGVIAANMIEPETGTVKKQLDLTELVHYAGNPATASEDALYTIDRDTGELFAVDIESGSAKMLHKFEARGPEGIFFDGSYLWVLLTLNTIPEFDDYDELFVMNPFDGSVVKNYRVANRTNGLISYGGSIWVTGKSPFQIPSASTDPRSETCMWPEDWIEDVIPTPIPRD